ncbi:hypothetical protein SARC_17010, partial [Sphaeroforma arctica JP610]
MTSSSFQTHIAPTVSNPRPSAYLLLTLQQTCLQFFLESIAASLLDPNTHVRHAAVYGMGVIAKFGGPAYIPMIQASIAPLCKVINMPEAKSADNVHCTENAISAI